MNILSAADLVGHLRAGSAPAILDVRSATEYAAGHVPGAMHASFWTLFFSPPAADPDEPLLLYCGQGPRARIAAVALRRQGFLQLIELSGHMVGWRLAGLPEATGHAPGRIE